MGWLVDEPSPPFIIRSKIGRRPLIGGRRIGKDCCILIGQGQEVHLGRWKVPWRGEKFLASLFDTCMKIEMCMMWEPHERDSQQHKNQMIKLRGQERSRWEYEMRQREENKCD